MEVTNTVIFNPKVSIIIPVYNGSKYLREAIDSALAQTYKNIEVTVVNDGSNDMGKTEEIARSYGNKIRYFYKKNGGVASALNMGIQEMTGEYFSWLSHDDVYYPNKIEVQIDYLKNGKRDVVLYSDYDFIDHSSRKIRTARIRHIKPDKFILSLLIGHPINGCTTLIPRICFEEIGLFNEYLKTAQDYEMWFRLARKYNVIHIPEILIKSRLHAEQCSITMGSEHFNEQSKFFIWYVKAVSSDVTDNSLPAYLLKTAIYLKRIGFFEAAKYAFDLAIGKKPKNFLLIRCLILTGIYQICNSKLDMYYWIKKLKHV